MFGLMKDLAGLLNQLSLNASIFPLRDHYQEVLTYPYRSKKRINQHQKQRSKMFFYGVVFGILILQKNIQKEFKKLIKNLLRILLIQKTLEMKIKSLLVILIMMKLSFPCKKKILARLK